MTDEARALMQEALDELDNVRWDDIWQRVDASGEDDLARWSRKYVGYVRDSIEKALAARQGDEG